MEQQIQNFSDKSNEYLNIVNKILENRKNAIEVYNDEKSTEEELLYICSKLFLNELSDEQITLYKESIIGIAINSDVNDEYYNAFYYYIINYTINILQLEAEKRMEKMFIVKLPIC